jgi:hypothetical protein
MGDAIAELAAAYRTADAREQEALVLELAAELREHPDTFPGLSMVERVAAVIDAGPPATCRSSGQTGHLTSNVNGQEWPANKNAPRTPRPLLEWPPEVTRLAVEVQEAAMKLRAAQARHDFGETPILARKLRSLTCALERTKLRHLALPDLPSVGKPAGSLSGRSRIAGTM